MRLRFIRDRGQLFLDLWPVNDTTDTWFSVDLVRCLFLGRSEKSAVLDEGYYATFLRDRLVEIECASHAVVLAVLGPAGGTKAASEQALAQRLYPRLEPGWLLLADRNFYSWAGTAAPPRRFRARRCGATRAPRGTKPLA